jgi:hypothetical protein
MLNELLRKHPGIKDTQLLTGAARTALPAAPGPYALAVAAFGTASYLTRHEMTVMTSRARRLTVLMGYRPGWLPDWYTGPARTRMAERAARADSDLTDLTTVHPVLTDRVVGRYRVVALEVPRRGRR